MDFSNNSRFEAGFVIKAHADQRIIEGALSAYKQ
jgi:hypothetical protein